MALLISAQTVRVHLCLSFICSCRIWCQRHRLSPALPTAHQSTHGDPVVLLLQGETLFLCDSLRSGVNGITSSPANPTSPVRSHRENLWQPVPRVSLDAPPKGGKTEPGLSQQQCFEC